MSNPLRSRSMIATAMSLVVGRRRTVAADPVPVNTTEPPSTPYAAPPVERTSVADRGAPYSLISW
ncbi:hypothetical protein AB0P21_15385 [Kribbella sp. NPDC056861]|uniref:hypothetical protein n=1 Tax=Kribbella sp. NPDC056861 TaxID=3154857 RepID=UPI0034274A3C